MAAEAQFITTMRLQDIAHGLDGSDDHTVGINTYDLDLFRDDIFGADPVLPPEAMSATPEFRAKPEPPTRRGQLNTNSSVVPTR